MKYLNKLFLLMLGLIMSLVACDTEKLHELNINPLAKGDMDMNYLFSGAELSLASNGFSGDNRYTDWRTNIGLCGGAIQQLTTFGSISASGNFYRHNEETASCIFDFSYTDQLKNIAEILKQTGPGGFQEGTRINTRNAARILRAWTFARLTDYYGAVPYFEANKGLTDEKIFFPAYDVQSEIYPDILKELEEARDGISAGNPDDGFKAADMIYGGDIAKWKKWANSLLLRYGMRLSDIAPSVAATAVQAAIAGGVFTSNDDNVLIPMATGPSVWTNKNGISRAFNPTDGGNQATLGEPFVNLLKGTDQNDSTDDDPRLKILCAMAEWGGAGWVPYKTKTALDQLGVPPGYSQAEVAVIKGWPSDFLIYEKFSRINYLLLQDDDPYMIMNHAEVEFLLAEASEKSIGGLTPADAQAHYDAGVKSAMQMYTKYDASFVISDAQVAAYLAAYPYGGGGVGGGKTNMEMIGDQMWASHFLNWYDAWTDWRRMDVPVLIAHTTEAAPITAGGQIFVRLRYPNSETVANPMWNASNAAKNHNNYDDKVWWDGGAE